MRFEPTNVVTSGRSSSSKFSSSVISCKGISVTSELSQYDSLRERGANSARHNRSFKTLLPRLPLWNPPLLHHLKNFSQWHICDTMNSFIYSAYDIRQYYSVWHKIYTRHKYTEIENRSLYLHQDIYSQPPVREMLLILTFEVLSKMWQRQLKQNKP